MTNFQDEVLQMMARFQSHLTATQADFIMLFFTRRVKTPSTTTEKPTFLDIDTTKKMDPSKNLLWVRPSWSQYRYKGWRITVLTSCYNLRHTQALPLTRFGIVLAFHKHHNKQEPVQGTRKRCRDPEQLLCISSSTVRTHLQCSSVAILDQLVKAIPAWHISATANTNTPTPPAFSSSPGNAGQAHNWMSAFQEKANSHPARAAVAKAQKTTSASHTSAIFQRCKVKTGIS